MDVEEINPGIRWFGEITDHNKHKSIVDGQGNLPIVI